MAVSPDMWQTSVKTHAPGEARTPDLRISLSILIYKYDALTDCATGAKSTYQTLSNGYLIFTCRNWCPSLFLGETPRLRSSVVRALVL